MDSCNGLNNTFAPIEKQHFSKTICSNDYETLTEDISVHVINQKVRISKMRETADRIKQLDHNLPKLLVAIFDEDVDRHQEQALDEMNVMDAFEKRRLDHGYNLILEQAAQTKLLGQISQKHGNIKETRKKLKRKG